MSSKLIVPVIFVLSTIVYAKWQYITQLLLRNEDIIIHNFFFQTDKMALSRKDIKIPADSPKELLLEKHAEFIRHEHEISLASEGLNWLKV